MNNSVHLAVAIGRSADKVYDYVSNPANLPEWAAGLSGSIEEVKGEWWAKSPMGKIKIEFVPKNELRVADHTVTMPKGETVLNPMRVLANGRESEVVFSLFRRADMTDAQFGEDMEAVRRDLNTLKRVLED